MLNLPSRKPVGLLFALLVITSSGLSAQSNASRKALESAAAKGNLAAQYALASAMELDGDIEGALKLLTSAAEAGYPGAQLKLAEFFETGRGVSVDMAKAKEWYSKAADQGLAQAANKLKELEAVPESAQPTAETPSLVASPVSNGSDAAKREEAGGVASTPASAATGRASGTTAEPLSVAEAGVQQPSQTPAASAVLITFIAPFFIALPVAFKVWKSVRTMVMNWYRSRQFFVSGRTAAEMITKEVGLRLQVEWIPLVAGFVVSFLIYFGLWTLLQRLLGIAV